MSEASLQGRLSQLPAVNEMLAEPEVAGLIERLGRVPAVGCVRRELEETRGAIRADPAASVPTAAELAQRVQARLTREDRPNLRRVLNATGIVLHTGLGRAPLAEEALRAIQGKGGYCNLETDLESGRRSHRGDSVRDLLCELTGAESATVVNNNAAATVLVLRALAADREVLVSRGQLIEIGGSFRLPDIMKTSGAVLREVGTTNRTHLSDYEQALSERTALLMRVHSSNYRIVGFAKSTPLAELVGLARRAGVRVVDDIGSGALFDVTGLTGGHEPVARESVAAGADVVLFSGDKLLGGPQAGIIVGKADCIEVIERDPLMRAVRVDKLALAALEATLRLHRDRQLALTRIPLYQMLSQTEDQLRRRAQALRRRLLRTVPGLDCRVVHTVSFVGGGSVPAEELPSYAVAVRPASLPVDEAARRLRTGQPSVFPRLEQDQLLFDLRTIQPGEEPELAAALAGAVGEGVAAIGAS
jgi:L-seryl-tRNA(Ser) seleniumtransferase